jgi:hypothetical protein
MTRPVPMLTRSLRYLIALLVLANGAVHLILYLDEYREVRIIGPLFLLNAVAAVLIAVALIAKPVGAFALAALAFSLATLGAFVLSRTTGLFGFTEAEVDIKAVVAIVAEVGAVIATGVWFLATRPAPGAVAVIGEREAVSR